MTAATQTVPTRARPYARTQKPTPRVLQQLLKRPLAPTSSEYAQVCAGLQIGDPAMDTLLTWMREAGLGPSRALFMQAVQHGVDSLRDAPEPLRHFFQQLTLPPSWIDQQAIQDGVRFIQGVGAIAQYVLRDVALMGGYLLSGFNQTLVLTGALEKGTAQRVGETAMWWLNCTDFNVTEPGSPAWQTTLHVRLVHGLVRAHLAQRTDWDGAHWGVPLCQTDMQATYLGFSVAMLGGLRKLGITITPTESRGVMHLWAYVGWLMGVLPDRLARDERDGIVRLHHAVLTQSKPDETSRQLGAALALEPFSRHFAHFESWQRKLAYHRHLSITRYFLPAKQMAQLGLPDDVLPWYPLVTLPARVAHYHAQRWVPGLRARQIRQGRAAQEAAVHSLFGQKPKAVLNLADNHPAAAKSGGH